MFTVTGMRYRNFSENGEPRVSSAMTSHGQRALVRGASTLDPSEGELDPDGSSKSVRTACPEHASTAGWRPRGSNVGGGSVSLAIGLVGVALALAGCKPKEKDVRLEPPIVDVTTVKPAGGAGRSYTGVVSSRFQSDLGFRIAGKVIQRLVDSGESVRAHQPLMRIDRTDFALALAAQDQVVSAARARSDQASADEAR